MEFGRLKLKRCKYGWMLFLGPYIGRCFDLYGEYSESEVSMMRAFLREGDTVVDVGANIGDLTVPLSTIVKSAGRVYAIESHPSIYNILCSNLALNDINNVKPINAFVASNAQVDTSAGQWGKFGYVSEIWETQFLSLDSLNLPACHLIKIDVDGKELEVLKSGESLIAQHRPILYFENDVRDLSVPLLTYALNLRYDLYWHVAPIFSQENFFANPENHWAPNNMASMMVLGVPSERKIVVGNLRRITDPNDWWS